LNEPAQRWPARVYGSGSEPDYRFTLANERTFLAWVRTALAAMVAGAVVHTVELVTPLWLNTTVAVVLVVCGVVSVLTSWLHWAQAERAMRHDRPLPSSPMLPTIGVVIVVVGGVLITVWL
jgi:putative membrane protein